MPKRSSPKTFTKVHPISAAVNRKILIVDDEQAVVEALSDILTEEGYTVASACNGREALKYLRSNQLPRLIILDLFMPEMDGWEFRREQLKDEKLCDVPAIVVTGAAAYAGIDVNVIIHKPLDVPRFLSVVSRYF